MCERELFRDCSIRFSYSRVWGMMGEGVTEALIGVVLISLN